MRLHVVSLPHTQTTKAYSMCAYTEKVRKFSTMMKKRGHEVFLYASEDNEADVTELITCTTKKEQEYFGFNGPTDYLSIDFNPNNPQWKRFNKNVTAAIKERIEPQDLILLITGEPMRSTMDAFPENIVVEFGIGYEGTMAKYRVFESYAWMHYMYGYDKLDGNFFDAVIPNYFEIDDFPSAEPEGYYLFIGRLNARKGLNIAQEVCQKAGKRLIVAGPGEFSGYGEYVGIVGPGKRGELMSHAIATFVPTIYIGPFEGVGVESLLCGTPVITTDWGAFTEYVLEGINGYRCRMFREFVQATEDVKKLDRSTIRRIAQSIYSTDIIAERYEKYFNQLLTLFGRGWYA